MMIFGIAVSTMIVVALVVFAIEVHLYRKYETRRGRVGTPKATAGEGHGAPLAS